MANKTKKPTNDVDPCDATTNQEEENIEYSPQAYQSLLDERDELRNRHQRALADYQNAQKRFSNDLSAARQDGIAQVLKEILPVLDHFDMALNQDTSKLSAEQFAQGVRIIREDLAKAFANLGVREIKPQPNDSFNPNEHEALSQLAVEGVEAGHVSSVYQPGYAICDRVIRPAKVTIAPS